MIYAHLIHIDILVRNAKFKKIRVFDSRDNSYCAVR